MNKDISKIYFSAEDIKVKITEMAKALNAVYEGEEVLFVGVLKGSLPFFVDLARCVSFPVMFDFICASSYGSSTKSSGTLKITKDLSTSVEGKNVLVVEDILDSGNTLFNLFAHLSKQNPKSLKLCCLLDKPSRRERDIKADFTGFTIPDEFVVGYGLDYAERYRELPYIGILKSEVYENR